MKVMKKIAVGSLLLLIACGGEQRPVTASCKPTVSVVLAGTASKAKKRAPAKKDQTQEVVQVYWDVSKSMGEFALKRKSKDDPWTDDLTPVVSALDRSVLLRAHAQDIQHYGVGEEIVRLLSAQPALKPRANSTVLHLAAEQIGTALANGTAQAAIVVSDLELNTPPPHPTTGAVVCRGVPLPATPEAGSLFGRCFENAIAASDAPLTRKDLRVEVFRKRTHDRELFILLLASDRAFGRRIADEIARQLDFSRHTVFDSGSVSAANVTGCRVTAPSPDVLIKAGGCAAKCFEEEASIQTECDLRRAANDAWIKPAGSGEGGVTYDTLKKEAGQTDERALVRFAIPCNTRPGPVAANVAFEWRERTPWAKDGNGDFAEKESVRDLFDSLNDAIVRTVAARKLRITMTVDP